MFILFIQAVSILLLAAYGFIALLYQHPVVWIVAPIVLVFVLRYANKTEATSEIKAGEVALLFVVPIMLSMGLLLRTGGATVQGSINLTLICFLSGVVIVSINYFLFRNVGNPSLTHK